MRLSSGKDQDAETIITGWEENRTVPPAQKWTPSCETQQWQGDKPVLLEGSWTHFQRKRVKQYTRYILFSPV